MMTACVEVRLWLVRFLYCRHAIMEQSVVCVHRKFHNYGEDILYGSAWVHLSGTGQLYQTLHLHTNAPCDFGGGNREELSFNDLSLTHCLLLCNSLILSSVIVGSIEICRSMEEGWLALTLHFTPVTGVWPAADFSVLISNTETWGSKAGYLNFKDGPTLPWGCWENSETKTGKGRLNGCQRRRTISVQGPAQGTAQAAQAQSKRKKKNYWSQTCAY